MRRNLISFLFALLPVVAFSDDEFSVHGCDAIIDGICYKFPSPNSDEAWVSYEWLHHAVLPSNTSVFELIYTEPDYSGDIVIPETISYNGKTYRVTGINEYAFYECRELTSVTLPGSITRINLHAFSGCTGLKSITIPENVTDIQQEAFSYCSALTDVTLPGSITRINLHAFYNCTGLKSITIPENVTDIQQEAFSYCSALTDVYCLPKRAPSALRAFDYVNLSDITLHIPLGSEDSYSNVSPWKDFGKAATGVTIDENHFPDYWFRRWILQQAMGFDGVLTEDEIAEVTDISLTCETVKFPCESTVECPCKSIKGIEYFTELTQLRCGGLALSELDVTKNTKLKNLWCFENKADMKIDMSNNTVLRRAILYGNRITEINLAGCSALKELQCDGNKLQALNVSDCTALTSLSCYGNSIQGEKMDELVESLPVTSSGTMFVYFADSHGSEQNVMTTRQEAAAKAKGWNVIFYNGKPMEDEDVNPEDLVSYIQGLMATIILPTAPDASKGKYYRLDRVDGSEIIFEQELQPRAHVPYIIVPFEDFSINLNDFELAGLSPDTVSIDGIRFIGSYTGEELTRAEDCYIDIIDKTPDCNGNTDTPIIGAIRAYLEVNPKVVRWDDPYHPGGTKAPRLDEEKMGIVLSDQGTDGLSPAPTPEGEGRKDATIYDLNGKMVNGQRSMVNGQSIYNIAGQRIRKMQRGINIVNGRKTATR